MNKIIVSLFGPVNYLYNYTSKDKDQRDWEGKTTDLSSFIVEQGYIPQGQGCSLAIT